MTKSHDRPDSRAGEPVQVYLDRADRRRLERLTDQLDTTKSDVLRRALESFERQVLDPDQHPALQVIGLGAGAAGAPLPYDVAREHDRFLAETEPGLGAEQRAQEGPDRKTSGRGRAR
jgi:hypothetical protein